MKRRYLFWTDDELAYLKANFYQGKRTELVSALRGRKWLAILKKAEKLGLGRWFDKRNDPSGLLEQTPEAYYWIGFLLADGNFTERRITLAVANKDIEHLLKFRMFVRSNNLVRTVTHNYQRLCISSVNHVKTLRKRFGIHNDKTHNPPNIQDITNPDLMFALVVGFIDGDGSISKRKRCNSYNLSVVGHPSWVPNFNIMKKFLASYTGEKDTSQPAYVAKVRTTLPQDKGTIREFETGHFYICNQAMIRAIKTKADELKLPYLQRKLGQVV